MAWESLGVSTGRVEVWLWIWITFVRLPNPMFIFVLRDHSWKKTQKHLCYHFQRGKLYVLFMLIWSLGNTLLKNYKYDVEEGRRVLYDVWSYLQGRNGISSGSKHHRIYVFFKSGLNPFERLFIKERERNWCVCSPCCCGLLHMNVTFCLNNSLQTNVHLRNIEQPWNQMWSFWKSPRNK